MSLRLEPFVNNGIYHVFNKTIDHRLVFNDDNNCIQLLNLIRYYRSNEVKFGYSQFIRLNPIVAKDYLKKILCRRSFRVEILSYCFMPNHFHFLLKQKKDKGISKFMGDLFNAFTRHFNLKIERKGPVFLPDFKSVMITNEAQLLHVSRYIHLNPYSNGLVDNCEKLINYPWSSLKEYIYQNTNKLTIQKDIISIFNNDKNKYKNFVLSNAEYQKTLETVKYLNKW
ncbi:hypothetical protein A3C23_05215 [Candidatus Roizmanbacteria bacterium RIFCSPHIGHO2_02_FULL_37_13b]|uniref:Transposase IS200-like domain-containing protein n=1 Tax=Candidatus Roizmanbacteria bacterium RIFCSPLOWO2_02_FULL_36_11 TaxID=1802071 RepID=A0A1F7JCK8_9BACT|nr:MAG: hypothetical protein A3C23_05215 [Candidatus Roizmanbacteria bacterium RIFCSPHIGHO2_02_FULL_37_13b]OGK53354.1 MAG: hypothetical protein A3H78_03575 [Candidatus Roizmanbacteria bacterium RIFCSPLOWO2_02_FULL_36_11]